MYAITPYSGGGNDAPKLGPPVNVFDLYRNIHQKKMKRLSGYDAVLQKCYGRVRQANALDQMRIMFEVPDFILGVPLYDIQRCMAYMIHQLRTHGFVVTYYFPRILYVSWDPRDLPEAQKTKAKHILTPAYEAPSQAVDAPPLTAPTPAAAFGPMGPRMRAVPSTTGGGGGGGRGARSSIPEYMTTYKPSGKFVLDLT